jgi:hypothetical protein
MEASAILIETGELQQLLDANTAVHIVDFTVNQANPDSV